MQDKIRFLVIGVVGLCMAASVHANTVNDAIKLTRQYFNAPQESRSVDGPQWDKIDDISEKDVTALKQTILTEARKEGVRMGWPEELKKHVIRFENPEIGPGFHELPYHVCPTKGEKPKNGWPLFINMHGGGKVASEYQIHKTRYKYYEGKFIVPRADFIKPLKRWGHGHLDLLLKLVTQMVMFEEVDPDRVYFMGFSEGGNGCFRLTHNRLDRVAGLGPSSASGGPPSWNYLNTALIHQWGRMDKNYDRNAYATAFRDRLWALRDQYPDRVPFKSIQHQKYGHQIPDYHKPFTAPLWLAQHKRNPVPDVLLWYNRRIPNWFWLHIDDPSRSLMLKASYKGNKIELESPACTVPVTVRLDDRMVDLDRPVTITLNGRILFDGKAPRRLETMLKTWKESMDPELIFPAEITVANDVKQDYCFAGNLALNRSVKASATSEKSAPGAAVDGNTSSGWQAPDGAPHHWFTVDLGGPCNLTGCQIVWHAISLYQYRIEGWSASKNKWVILADQARNPLARQLVSHDISASGVSKVRVTATGLGTAPMGLKELQVFGKAVGKGGTKQTNTVSEGKTIAAFPKKYHSGLSQALEQAQQNRTQILHALQTVVTNRDAHDGELLKEAAAYLVVHMPPRDLLRLTGDYLYENVRYAVEAIDKSPWKDNVPREVLLNDVVPYAFLDESRDPWRKEFYEKFAVSARAAKTPGQAALLINKAVFSEYQVKYDRTRSKTNLSPYESSRERKATCTGQSILGAAACRACGIPARVAGVPSWKRPNTDERGRHGGNHSWLEIWDNGAWHALGPSGKALGRTWFIRKMDIAKDSTFREHSVYAATWNRSKLTPSNSFLMVWSNRDQTVPAINVTDRYQELSRQMRAQADAEQ